jgi:hypothetical protein
MPFSLIAPVTSPVPSLAYVHEKSIRTVAVWVLDLDGPVAKRDTTNYHFVNFSTF